jgi:threonine dehydratase
MTTPPHPPPLPTSSSIRSASTLIAPYIHRTPLLTCATLTRLANTPLPHESQPPTFSLFFKTENLQKIGAFKARGAHHALLRLIERLGLQTVRQRGVVTHSSGNHAQALALAASTLGVKCTIVMPSISTKSKIEGTRVYCSDVIFSGSTSVEREAVVRRVQERTGAVLVPPYDDCESRGLFSRTNVLL